MRVAKRTTAVLVAGLIGFAVGGIYVEHRSYENGRRTLMQSAEAAATVMHAAPINKDWIVEGSPVTESREVARSYDDSARVYLWRTTAGKFKWIYEADEIVTILDGDVFITDTDGTTRHLKTGDVAMFPVGAVLNWNVPDHVLKSAIVNRPVPKLFQTALRLLRGARGWFAPERAMAL